MTIVGAFVSCNAMLDRPPLWSANSHGRPGAYACHFVPAHRAGAWRSSRGITRDLVAHLGAPRTGAGAWRSSGRINRDLVGASRAHPAHRPERFEPRCSQLVPPLHTRREHLL